MDPPPLKKLKNAGDDIEIQPLSYHEQVSLIFVINESAKLASHWTTTLISQYLVH